MTLRQWIETNEFVLITGSLSVDVLDIDGYSYSSQTEDLSVWFAVEEACPAAVVYNDPTGTHEADAETARELRERIEAEGFVLDVE